MFELELELDLARLRSTICHPDEQCGVRLRRRRPEILGEVWPHTGRDCSLDQGDKTPLVNGVRVGGRRGGSRTL